MSSEKLYIAIRHYKNASGISSWTTGSGRLARPKNFKTPFFSRYQKFLSWGNSNWSRTTPKFFSNFFSTNMVAGGVQNFCILEGATEPLIE